MAQTKVTRYFSARKNATIGDNRSQKRKIDSVLSTEDISQASVNIFEDRFQKKRKIVSFETIIPPVRAVSKSDSSVNKHFEFEINESSEMVTQKQTRSKEKMDVTRLKECLSKCSKLEDLKTQLASMNNNLRELRRSSRARQGVSPAPTESVTDSTQEAGLSREKCVGESAEIESTTPAENLSDSKDAPVPAYQKYQHLATPGTPSLTLPYKYRQLLERFSNVDTVVSMLHNRSEICTFSKLKMAVQRMSNRNFEHEHLGQLKTVYPNAYIMRQERNIPGEKPGPRLTVEANLHEGTNSTDAERGAHTYFSLTHMTKRKAMFHNCLVTEVRRHHEDFLSRLTRPLSVSPDKLARWHPKFALDQVPDIDPSPLPQAPVVKTFNTAKDVLEQSRAKLIPRVESALRNVAMETARENTSPPPPISTTAQNAAPSTVTPNKPPATPCLDSVMKGIPSSLLEKIRAREAANVARKLTRQSGEERRIVLLKRLPAVMRQLRSIFITEKRPALPKPLVIKKLSEGSNSVMSTGDAEEHIKMLLEVVPDWLTLAVIRKGEFIKMNRSVELSRLDDIVNALIHDASR